ncbi:hypothetical protein [Bdellovibrio sp. HCB-162]|uniref:hypothetical protein n=1 Tax=Bdellovibrio sp. HCB-162 TaxID=3394234 RepID=UPI0039BC2C18
MRNWILSGMFLLSSGAIASGGHGDHGGGHSPKVPLSWEILGSQDLQAGMVRFEFRLLDAKTSQSLSDQDLVDTHEKKIHLLVYDKSLNEFQHVHPEFNGSRWSVDLSFVKNGDYKVWIQGQTKAGVDFNLSNNLKVSDGEPAWPLPPGLKDIRSGGDGDSVATLNNQKISNGQMAMLDLVLTQSNGQPSEVTPYLGAFAHVVAVPEDGSTLIHVHPMEGAVPNKGMLHVTFPKSGAYRLWIQFIDRNVLRTVPLSVKVN